VQASGQPYQKYYDLGYFRLVPVLVHKGQHSIPYNQTMITGKGFVWLKALMDSQVMPTQNLTVSNDKQEAA
jgi:phage antirepressor YoqD-like protein